MPVYNKLVRDKIPAIIEADGKACTTRILNEKEYELALEKKLVEEVNEFLSADEQAESVEELADILEIIRSLAYVQGSSFEDVERVRADKFESRGGFKQGVYLMEVKDE
ncbi:MAG TPA: nucleoside triphosphate pyrophosphohydrolase [Bacillota bacterium]|nr:nucleoside triphosphate pyrophosphohydrolase [Bacillota bacterium]